MNEYEHDPPVITEAEQPEYWVDLDEVEQPEYWVDLDEVDRLRILLGRVADGAIGLRTSNEVLAAACEYLEEEYRRELACDQIFNNLRDEIWHE